MMSLVIGLLAFTDLVHDVYPVVQLLAPKNGVEML